jgi:O-antigen/teichoic acid export membrane protein
MVPRLLTLGRTRELRRTVLSAVLPVAVGGVVAAGLVAHFAPTLAHVFMQQGSTVLGANYLRSIAPYLAVAPVATVLIAGTRGFGSVVPFVTIQNIGLPLVRPLVIALLVVAGVASDRWVANAWGLPWAVAAVVALYVILRQLRRAVDPAELGDPVRSVRVVAAEFWSFASARAFAGAAEVTLIWLDVLLVGWLVGPLQAGIYATASRFVTTGTLALQASRIAISPRLSHLLVSDQKPAAERLYNGSTQAVVASSWPLYLGLACFAPLVLRLFGHGFTHGSTALSILSLAMLVDMATGNISTVLLMAGSSRWNLLNAGTGLTIDVVVDLLLIPHHGATGAAIGWAASIITINVMACFEVHYLMGLQIFDHANLRAMAVALVCFGLPGVVLRAVAGHSPWSLVVWAVVGGTSYGSWWWRRRNDPDVLGVLQALHLRRDPDVIAQGARG